MKTSTFCADYKERLQQLAEKTLDQLLFITVFNVSPLLDIAFCIEKLTKGGCPKHVIKATIPLIKEYNMDIRKKR